MILPVARSDIARLLPDRPEEMHKGNRGRLLVIGGSSHYPGAPALSALGALRSGAGVVTLLSSPAVCSACAARHPEVVCRPCSEDWLGAALAEAPACGAAVIGPGLERLPHTQELVRDIWGRWPKPLLVDGDGLFALSGEGSSGLSPRDDAVLTPHEGEAARLLGTSAESVRGDREAAARRLAERWGCVVLKGHGSLVAVRGEEEVRRLDWGGAELAVPGSGDVLSGVIGTFLAAGISAREAALLGAALHGMAGSRLRSGGVDGVLASELAAEIRPAIKELRL